MGKVLERITYVEDEADVRAVTELALKVVGGFHIDVCACGPEAIEKTPGFGPDLILLDVMMPGMDGVELFGKLKAMPELADTPVVFITAKAQSHEVDGYMQLGAIDVIRKPFDAMTLADNLRAIWKRVEARENASGMQQQLRRLVERHCITLADEAASLESCLGQLEQPTDPAGVIARAVELVYKIKGSSGSIGFHQVSAAAQSLQMHLRVLQANGGPPSALQIQTMQALLGRLRNAIESMSPEDSALYHAEFPEVAEPPVAEKARIG